MQNIFDNRNYNPFHDLDSEEESLHTPGSLSLGHDEIRAPRQQGHRSSQKYQSMRADDLNGIPLGSSLKNQLLVIDEKPLINVEGNLQSVSKNESLKVPSRFGKPEKKTFSETPSTGQSSTNDTTSQDSCKKKKNKWKRFDLNQFNENDKKHASEKKSAIDDGLPCKPTAPVQRILDLPSEEEQKSEFDKTADKFHELLETDITHPDFGKLSCQMKEFRYWQAVSTGLKKLDLHRLTSYHFEVIEWYFKSLKAKIEKGQRYPKEIEIVCGKGKHNSNRTSELGPQLDEFLEEKEIDATIPFGNPGTRYIKTNQSFFQQ